ncbi:unnamed protein product [Effrenium voratum]|nr:unnamed protein product [Effrenium voratum]
MARNRRRGANQQGQGRGRGQGRGTQPSNGGSKGRGRGQQDLRGTLPGVLRRPKDKSKGQSRNKISQTRRRNAGRAAGALPVEVETQIREDGMFRHSEIKSAHKDAVMSVVMAADCIYTASRDKTLKRWKVCTTAGAFELKPELEVPLGEVCWCLISAGDWLFCGLGDGNIKGFMKNGQEAVLRGHAKRVSSLITHQHVLLSGASDGSVRCWQLNAHTSTFECTHSISEGISGSVTSLAVLGEGLWVGGTSGVALVELASLRVVKQLEPRKYVSGLLQFEGHMRPGVHKPRI